MNTAAVRRALRAPFDPFGLRARARLARIEDVCERTCRGIHKRIDELREDLELLQRECPELLIRCWWIEGHFGALDHFLCTLAEEVGTGNALGAFTSYPRPWPGKPRVRP